MHVPDAIVVGAGPNGLAAAITLARSGRSVVVLEAASTPGGGARTAELTLPGFQHDICSAVHPLAAGSPVFQAFGLGRFGLEWVHPPAPLVHPLDGGGTVTLERSVEATAARLGPDAEAWSRVVGGLARHWDGLVHDVLRPFPPLPRHPLVMARFALRGLRSARAVARRTFRTTEARALLAGNAAHGMLPLEQPPSAGFGLILAAAAHAVGWPAPRGGAAAITRALVACLAEEGGEVRTGHTVASLDELPPAPIIMLDLTPRQVLELAGERLPAGYARRLRRFRLGPGVFKVDWALSEPVPWTSPEAARAGTLHLGGSLEEIAAGLAMVAAGGHPDHPFVLFAQPSRFDPSRAPAGRHTAWGYCHVPAGSTRDMTAAIESQVERFAPGFRDTILARHTMGPRALEAHNPNLVGGHINGGAQDLRQLFFRPVPALDPYRTPLPGIYICSSSTPPGGGVHGLCGWFAARSAIRG